MKVQITQNNERIHFNISGDIDEVGASELKQQFEQKNLTGCKEVVFNLHDVTYIGSAGLGKLLLFYKKLSTENIDMKVENPSKMALDILTELKLDSLFAVV